MNILKGFVLVAFLILNCYSQKNDSLQNNHSLERGQWSLQFEVGNDFTLTSFDGVIFSLKYHFSPKFAVRFGAGVDLRSSNSDIEYKDYYSGYSGFAPVKDHYHNIVFTSNILFYPKPDKLFKIFFGLGPRASYLNSNDERIYVDGFKGYWKSEVWSVGLNGVIGAEWFPVKFLSLFGEYSMYGTYGNSTTQDYVVENFTGIIVEYYNQNSDSFEFRGNIVHLGLSIYF